jgi:hypothetical protein
MPERSHQEQFAAGSKGHFNYIVSNTNQGENKQEPDYCSIKCIKAEETKDGISRIVRRNELKGDCEYVLDLLLGSCKNTKNSSSKPCNTQQLSIQL